MDGFIFGGDTGTSYEALMRKRKIADLMAARSTGGVPHNVGEGLNAIGQALAGVYIDKKISPGEDKAREDARMALARALGGNFGSLSSNGGAPVDMPSAPPMTVSGPAGMPVPTDAASGIVQGLIQRGVPEHIAQGIVMNMHDESGLNPAAVGDNGNALGLAQWNGPRKAALEAYASSKGMDPTDPNAQLDYLMTELQGPEKGAMGSLMATDNPQDAAVAFLNNFERPAEGPRQAREAQYRGGTMSTQGGDVSQLLAQVLDNPFATDSQRAIAQMLIGKSFEQPQAPDLPNSVQEYQYAVQNGFKGTYEEWKKADNPSTNVTVDNASEFGTIPSGYELVTDPETQAHSLQPIPGGPAAAEAEVAANASRVTEDANSTSVQTIINAAKRAREAASGRMVDGILGRVAALNPESANAEIYRQIKVLESVGGAETLQGMRAESKSGASGFGALTAPELELLKRKLGALDPASPNFARDLDDYELTLFKTIYGPKIGQEIFDQSRSDAPPTDGAPVKGGPTVIDGYTIEAQ